MWREDGISDDRIGFYLYVRSGAAGFRMVLTDRYYLETHRNGGGGLREGRETDRPQTRAPLSDLFSWSGISLTILLSRCLSIWSSMLCRTSMSVLNWKKATPYIRQHPAYFVRIDIFINIVRRAVSLKRRTCPIETSEHATPRRARADCPRTAEPTMLSSIGLHVHRRKITHMFSWMAICVRLRYFDNLHGFMNLWYIQMCKNFVNTSKHLIDIPGRWIGRALRLTEWESASLSSRGGCASDRTSCRSASADRLLQHKRHAVARFCATGYKFSSYLLNGRSTVVNLQLRHTY